MESPKDSSEPLSSKHSPIPTWCVVGIVLIFASYMTSCQNDPVTDDSKNNINRAQLICEGAVEARLGLSSADAFAYAGRLVLGAGFYKLYGSFRDGRKRGHFICGIRYAGNGGWSISDLSVSWPILDGRGNPVRLPSGHKQHEVFIKDGIAQSIGENKWKRPNSRPL